MIPILKSNQMSEISNQVKRYLMTIDSQRYVIYNYDYFTTQYHIPHDTNIRIPEEYRILLNLTKKISQNRVVVDVGGNCGLFSIPTTMEGYKVYTFEPVSMNVEILELNKKENNCTNMTIVPKALSNFNGTKKIYVPYCSDNTSFDLSVAVSNMKNKNYREENVECITFDTWLDENENPDVGFIKIDVQGFEYEVLLGMQKFLSQCSNVYLFLEWDERHTSKAGSSLSQIESFLNSNGFNFAEKFYGDNLFYKS